MAYISQSTKKSIVSAIIPIFAKYNIKASFGIKHNSTFIVTIKSGVLDFINNYNTVQETRPQNNRHLVTDYLNVNQYWFHTEFTGEAREFLIELYTAIKTAGKWFEDSSLQHDYFDTAFFIDIKIGNWNKAYELTT